VVLQKNTTYRGEFREDLRNGRGIITKRGKNMLGIYENGKIQRMAYGK